MRLTGHVAYMGEMRDAYIVITRELEVPVSSICRWKGNIKMDLK
jgi:hypothetical protein